MRDQWPSTQKRTGQPPAHRGGSPRLTPAAQASGLQSPRGHQEEAAVPGTGGASGMWTLRAKPGRSRGNQEGGALRSLRSLRSLWAQRSGRSAVRAAKGRAASTRGRWRAAPGRGAGSRWAPAAESRGTWGRGGGRLVLCPQSWSSPCRGGTWAEGTKPRGDEETARRSGQLASHRPPPAPRPAPRPAPPPAASPPFGA